MKNIQRKIFVIICFVLSLQGQGQDIHFSSTGFNPMFFNPAMTAFMNNKFRVSTIYRNQWQTVSKGYNTFFAAMEMQPYVSFKEDKGVGIGISFTNDVAGSLSYGERDIAIAGSYFFSLDRRNKTYLSFGVEGIRKNWAMDIKKAEFNPQGTYDDDIRYESLNTYDISLGTALQHASDNDRLFYIGAALFHINQPSLSYFGSGDYIMHRRFFANISYLFPYSKNDRISFNPQIFFQHQHKFNEILAGAECILDIGGGIFTYEVFSAGIYLRNTEAIVLSPKFRYNNFIAGLSYDVNISKLSKVSNTYGAVEIWLSYAFNPLYNTQKTTKIPCPIF